MDDLDICQFGKFSPNLKKKNPDSSLATLWIFGKIILFGTFLALLAKKKKPKLGNLGQFGKLSLCRKKRP